MGADSTDSGENAPVPMAQPGKGIFCHGTILARLQSLQILSGKMFMIINS